MERKALNSSGTLTVGFGTFTVPLLNTGGGPHDLPTTGGLKWQGQGDPPLRPSAAQAHLGTRWCRLSRDEDAEVQALTNLSKVSPWVSGKADTWSWEATMADFFHCTLVPGYRKVHQYGTNNKWKKKNPRNNDWYCFQSAHFVCKTTPFPLFSS